MDLVFAGGEEGEAAAVCVGECAAGDLVNDAADNFEDSFVGDLVDVIL
jgi:hypothetical protein